MLQWALRKDQTCLWERGYRFEHYVIVILFNQLVEIVKREYLNFSSHFAAWSERLAGYQRAQIYYVRLFANLDFPATHPYVNRH